MNTLRVHFTDFSSDFVPEDDFFFRLLSRRYQLVLDARKPDYLLYSCYGHDFLHYDCVRIFYTAENIRPDFNLCDYAIGFDYCTFADRYLRFPNYARYERQFENLLNREQITRAGLARKTGFCNFIYSNAFADPARDRFFHLLAQYRRVDAPGKHLNNMREAAGERYHRDWRAAKVEFQRDYKFSIAFENSSSPGYTTEKLMHAFLAGTVPIYWGNTEIAREFNPHAFINCHDFPTFELAIRRVIELDQDESQYLRMLNEPCFPENRLPDALTEEMLLDFFSAIFDQPLSAARRRPRHGTTQMYEDNMRVLAATLARKDRLRRLQGKIAQLVRAAGKK